MYTFTKLHDRRIPNVGVGPVEFQLKGSVSLDATCREIQDKYKTSLSRDVVQQLTLSAATDRRGLSPFIFIPVQRHVLRRLTAYWLPRYLLHKDYLNELGFIRSCRKFLLARDVIYTILYISRLCYDVSVRPSVSLCNLKNGASYALIYSTNRKLQSVNQMLYHMHL